MLKLVSFSRCYGRLWRPHSHPRFHATYSTGPQLGPAKDFLRVIGTSTPSPLEEFSKIMESTSTTQPKEGSSRPSCSHKKAAKQKTGEESGDAKPNFGNQKPSAKLRGLPKDSEAVKISKTLSWILRHGAQSEKLAMRPDGFVKVDELLANPRLQSLDLNALQEIVKADSKQRYNLVFEPTDPTKEGSDGVWFIRAVQGHSLKDVKLDLTPILSPEDIPTKTAVHGTNNKAWATIVSQHRGLSKMTRNHIHLAQGVPGDGIISGMRHSSAVFIYIDVQKALEAGIKFFLSDNGVVLTEGDSAGYLSPEFFLKVENSKGEALHGWEIPAS